jgi:predicted enzyme related to lactoylglutathione lyase
MTALTTRFTALRRRFRKGATVLCTLGLALIAMPACAADDAAWPAITEPPTSAYVPGKWVWAELFTESRDKAVEFYGKVFDWSFQAFSAGRGAGYTLALSDGEPVGGMLEREHAYDQQRGSRWVGMISVADVKAAARYAGDHGGKVVAAPRLLKGRGELALLADPEGAIFGVMHSSSGDPPDYLAEDRQWVWVELWAKDPKKMAEFYSGVAGYEAESVTWPDGRVGYFLASGGYTRCGIIPTPAPTVASAWLPYLRVDDVTAATTQAQQAGARIVVPPGAEIREGRMALIVDPTGAPVGLAQLRTEQSP